MTFYVMLDDKLRMSKKTTCHKMFRQLALGGAGQWRRKISSDSAVIHALQLFAKSQEK